MLSSALVFITMLASGAPSASAMTYNPHRCNISDVCDSGSITTTLGGNTVQVPEPGTLALVGTGMVCAGALIRRRWFGRKEGG